MGFRSILPALVAAGGLPALACSSDTPPVEVRPVQVQCSVDQAVAGPCVMRDRVAPDGTHHITFQTADGSVRFVGRSQGGWWSGELDGRPAMGYERNRGRVAYSTADLTRTFEWWSQGHEHGAY
jgi:hypothetical protein